jgi:glycosyltransferase involved in cell wall biosynthesis
MISLTVLVPVYNEERYVEQSLNRLLVLQNSPFLNKVQVVVVDDCSRDKSAEILRNYEKRASSVATKIPFEWVFIRHELNQGKGKAIQTALTWNIFPKTCLR